MYSSSTQGQREPRVKLNIWTEWWVLWARFLVHGCDTLGGMEYSAITCYFTSYESNEPLGSRLRWRYDDIVITWPLSPSRLLTGVSCCIYNAITRTAVTTKLRGESWYLYVLALTCFSFSYLRRVFFLLCDADTLLVFFLGDEFRFCSVSY